MSSKKPMLKEDWMALFAKFRRESENTGETIKRIQNYIKKHYSFKLPKDAEAYVYYGSINGKLRVWQVVGAVTKDSNGKKGYISDTEAGQLFNDRENFQAAMNDFFRWDVATRGNDIHTKAAMDEVLYEGQDHTGKITFRDGSTARPFNDFFSQNYVGKIHSSNVHAIFAGDPTSWDGKGFNCFIRVEFDSIKKNDLIKTINNVDKDLLIANDAQGYYFITDTVKSAQARECCDIHFTFEERPDTTLVNAVPYDFPDAKTLAMELMGNGKISDISRSDSYIESMPITDQQKKELMDIRTKGGFEWDLLADEKNVITLKAFNYDIDKMAYSIANKIRIEREEAKAGVHDKTYSDHILNDVTVDSSNKKTDKTEVMPKEMTAKIPADKKAVSAASMRREKHMNDITKVNSGKVARVRDAAEASHPDMTKNHRKQMSLEMFNTKNAGKNKAVRIRPDDPSRNVNYRSKQINVNRGQRSCSDPHSER